MPSTSSSSPSRPVLAIYSHIYLDRVEKHVYRQIVGITGFDIHVFYQELRNVNLFPLQSLHSVRPADGTGYFKRMWQKYVCKAPPFVYRGHEAQLLEDLKHFEVDVLHIYFGHYGVALLSLFDKVDIPVIVSFHGKDATAFFNDADYAQKARQMFHKAALIFVRSEHMGRLLVERGCPPDKIRVTRAALDLSGFPFMPRALPAGGEPVRFVQACRLIPKKGLETLIEAFREVTMRYPNVQLEIVGSGPLEDRLKQMIGHYGLEDSVYLRGYMEMPGLIETLSRAHAFIHPSESDAEGNMEGIPNAIIEAMAMGLPVIATHHAGIPELIVDGENGLLVPEKNPQQLAQAICRLIEHPDWWPRFSQAGRRAVEEKHEMKAQMARLEGFYHEAMALKRQTPSVEAPVASRC